MPVEVSPLGDVVAGVRRIAVLRANGVGDFMMALPALESLRAAYPKAEITLLGSAWHAEFLADRPGPIDKVVVLPAVPGVSSLSGATLDNANALPDFLAQMREQAFDLAIQLQDGGVHANNFIRALGARTTAGLRAPDASLLDRWLPYHQYQPEVYRYLEVVGMVGAEAVTVTPHLVVTPADDEALDAQSIPDGEMVAVLHPGATDPRRRWPVERFAEVGDALANAGVPVVVVGAENETELVDGVVAAMKSPAQPLAGVLGVGGLAALCARAAVVVANDNDALQVAMAVDAPTVGIFFAGDLVNAGPGRQMHRPQLSWTVHCPECGTDCTADIAPGRGTGQPCPHRCSFVVDVPVSEVADAALDLLAERRARLGMAAESEVDEPEVEAAG